MTENKRFKQLNGEFAHSFIDTEDTSISYICDNENDCKNIVDLLNELNDENEQLKGEVAHYKLILMSLEQQAKRISSIKINKND